MNNWKGQPDDVLDGKSICVMLVPDNDLELQLLPHAVKDFHITIFWLGKVKEIEDSGYKIGILADAVNSYAKSHKSIKATATKIKSFPKGDNGYPIVLEIESEGAVNFNKFITEELAKENIKTTNEFDYNPHITLGYAESDKDLPVLDHSIDLTFTTIDVTSFGLWKLGENGMQESKELEIKAHDLIFYSERSTPQVVSRGGKAKPKKGYGKETRRRAATAEEERQIAKGKWVRVDQSGNKPTDGKYKRTKYRPQLVKKDDGSIVIEYKSSLDRSPRANYIETEGGLPKYIRKIAEALVRDRGFTVGHAVATAIERCRRWASGTGNVNADTVAKATKAIAQWEALKARAKARPNK